MILPQLAAVSPWARIAATPVAYLLLWSGLAALSVAFVVLFRSRWGQSKPLRKCAVLSLLVHVLLACLAMTVKIVVGDGSGGGPGAPIRVHVVSGDFGSPTMARMSSPPLLEHNDDHTDAADPTEMSPPANDISAPPLATVVVPPPAPVPAPEEPSSAPTVAANRVAPVDPADIATNVVPPSDIPRQPAAEAATSGTTPRPSGDNNDPEIVTLLPTGTNANSSQPGLPPGDPYAGRSASDRIGLIEMQGGSTATEAAVVAALEWLQAAQSPDGRWDADRYGAGIERKVLGEDRRGAGRDADTGVSALALLAVLGAGHTHLQGDYQTTVEHGLEFLLHSQAADGNLFGGAGLYAQMYCHSMATFALAEAEAVTGDRRLAAGVSKAIAYSVRAQDPTAGGWRYRPGDKGDTSQLGWQVMSLASSERAGAAVPLQTWTGVDRFLRSVRRGTFGGLASYRDDSPTSTSMTAEALYCRLLMTEKTGVGIDERVALEATRQILSSPPTAQQPNLYYWYYATLALHHRQLAGDDAANAWRTWNEALTQVLLASQESSGPNAGSWTPDTMWGGYGGRVYSTAMAAMCLEVYYRYAPLPGPSHSSIVTRPDYQERSK